MTDDNSAGYPAPSAEPRIAPPATPVQVPPAQGGAFDWLLESHQQSAPMAPLSDEVPAPIPAQPRFDFPDPAAPPEQVLAPQFVPTPELAVPAGSQSAPVMSPPPQVIVAPPPAYERPAPAVPPLPVGPLPTEAANTFPPSSFAGATGIGALTLERHQSRPRSANGALDWAAFVLAFLLPPVGLLAGIAAAVSDSRAKGFVASIAKAAIGIGAALSLILGVVFVVVGKIDGDQAAHNAIVASSRAYCAKLQSNPATLTSDTFGWPSPGNTIPASVSSINSYDSAWKALVALAPAGILADTKKVEAAAAGILSSVKSTGTLDNSSNVAQMQNVVAQSGIGAWVSEYCK